MRRLPLATRLALAMLVVAGVALAVLGAGVMRVGADAFAALMMAAGSSADEAHAMFDHSVALVVGAAGLVAGVAAVGLAWWLGRRLARPIERLVAATAAVAEGDLERRLPVEGPPELRDLALAYNAMAARLREQETMRREFVVNAAHELRTPLTNLQGYLEALRDGVVPAEPAVFDSLREEVDRLTRLAASLDVLAGEPGDRPAPARVDLGAAVAAAAELAAPAFARRGIRLEVDAPAGAAVVARPDDLRQVVANLLQNAARYAPEGSWTTVTVAARGGEATVEVANPGPPIPAEELPRLWERFYRLEKSRDRELGGAGIGLAIVRRLVEDAGGRVGARSDEAATTFWFSLPSAR